MQRESLDIVAKLCQSALCIELQYVDPDNHLHLFFIKSSLPLTLPLGHHHYTGAPFHSFVLCPHGISFDLFVSMQLLDGTF